MPWCAPFGPGTNNHSEAEIQEAARAVSPVYRVGQPTVPFLLIHGDADQIVPISHSQKLVAAIKTAGGHPWLTLPEEVKVMADWFDRKLIAPAPIEPH